MMMMITMSINTPTLQYYRQLKISNPNPLSCNDKLETWL